MAKWFNLRPEQKEDLKKLRKGFRFFAKGLVCNGRDSEGFSQFYCGAYSAFPDGLLNFVDLF
jgi:hypothetical protein